MRIPTIYKKDYKLVQDLNSLLHLLDEIKAGPAYVAYDLETDGVEPASCSIIGIGLSNKIGTGRYIVLRYWDIEQEKLVNVFSPEDEDLLIEALMNVLMTKKLIMHNAVFDICTTWHFYKHRYYLVDALHADTILMKHTYLETRPHGLKDIARKWKRELGIPENEDANAEQIAMKESITKNGGKMTKTQYDLYKADSDLIGYYGAADCDLTLRVFEFLEDKLAKDGRLDFFYNKEVMPLCKYASIVMKAGGLPIDLAYFEAFKDKLEQEAKATTHKIYSELADEIAEYEAKTITSKIAIKRAGDFPKQGLKYFNLPVPTTADGRETLAKKALEKMAAKFNHPFIDWLLWTKDSGLDEPTLQPQDVLNIQKQLYAQRFGGSENLFSLSGKDAMMWLVYEKFKVPVNSEKVSKKTGKASLDEDVLLEIAEAFPIAKDILALRKIEKLLSTYLHPILKKHVDGVIYPDMNQTGTTSGRYSCSGGLNLQTLPRDDVRIKQGFIAPPGYKFVSADFSSLEPRIFCWVSQDVGLKEIFQKGLDFYSKIAIDVLGVEGVSADPDAPNALKKLMPEKRQVCKGFALAVPYGANAYRLHMETGRPLKEHQEEIEAYLEAYPGLKKYMTDQENAAIRKGMVETQFGRRRHLYRAKKNFEEFNTVIFSRMQMAVRFAGEEGDVLFGRYLELRELIKQLKGKRDKIEELELARIESNEIKDRISKLGKAGIELYSQFRSDLNNAKNSPIQMTAAHVANAAAIKYAKSLLEQDIDGYLCLQIHDELCSIIREDQAELAAQLLKDAMENNWVTEQIDVPIIAEPIISNNLAEAK